MRTQTTSARSAKATASGATALETFNNTNAATFAGVTLAAVTGGGALFVGAAVAPSQVLGGAAVASSLLVLGHNKSENGGLFNFRKPEAKDAAPAATTEASAPAAA